ncbi:hypothetical protein C8T65DRAFT_730679 [Cerioporus squamosus]|nr:hypothetical protein C8T65DRAFT_730679 [Cerioporus squamosus]
MRLIRVHRVLTLSIAVLFVDNALSANTDCISDQLDWYTDYVGETPCMTFQRLLQTCDENYQVPLMSSSPVAICTQNSPYCCCNSIAYGLYMLCLNCQLFGPNNHTQDRASGGYQAYLGSCKPSSNRTLDATVQEAVCNQGIRIEDPLYDIFWSDGTWAYGWFEGTTELRRQANNNQTFSRCPGQNNAVNRTSTSATTTGTMSRTSTNPPLATASTNQHSGNRTNVGAIVGGVLGGVGALFLSCIGCILLRRRRRARSMTKHRLLPPSSESTLIDVRVASHPLDPATISPFIVPGGRNDLNGRSADRKTRHIPSRHSDTELSSGHAVTFATSDIEPSVFLPDAAPTQTGRNDGISDSYHDHHPRSVSPSEPEPWDGELVDVGSALNTPPPSYRAQ